MSDPENKKKLIAEVAEIDSQMAALAKLKQQHLARLSAVESLENQMTREERRAALIDVLVEGIVYLGQNGLLSLTEDQVKPVISSVSRRTQKIKSPNGNG